MSGINQLNATVQALSASMTSSQSLQAASTIGHAALVPGSEIDLLNGVSNGAVELTQPADKVTVTITDAKGNTVRTLQLGAQDTGIADFKWDGTDNTGAAVANGAYKFSAAAELSGNKSTPAALSYGLVNSVSLSASGAKLNVGNLGDIDMSSVRRIL